MSTCTYCHSEGPVCDAAFWRDRWKGALARQHELRKDLADTQKSRDHWQANALAHDEDWTLIRHALNIPSDATADDIVHHIRVNRTRAEEAERERDEARATTNQGQDRQSLIDRIQEQDRIIRKRNGQIKRMEGAEMRAEKATARAEKAEKERDDALRRAKNAAGQAEAELRAERHRADDMEDNALRLQSTLRALVERHDIERENDQDRLAAIQALIDQADEAGEHSVTCTRLQWAIDGEKV